MTMTSEVTASEPTIDLATAQSHAQAVVARSGSSFLLGMKILPAERRQAMFAIYAFCREVDDIADEGGTTEERLAGLSQWREEVERLYQGRPTRPTSQALLEPVRRFNLPQAEFVALIDGMEMDARESMRAPDLETLLLYCRRVAGTVGLLSLPVFGASDPDAPRFAIALADALQLTNILRDIAEDAGRGRLYLPRDLLLTHGIDPALPVDQVLRHPGLPGVFHELLRLARKRYRDADAALIGCRRANLRPALLMMGIYEAILDTLERTGWQPEAPPIKLSRKAKLWAAFTRGWLRPRWRPFT